MPRPTLHEESAILSAASRLVAKGGPGAATMAAISKVSGAANGSLYHRFGSRDRLLGRLWLNKAAAFQDRFEQALQHADARQAGLEAALSMPRGVRKDPEGARIMLLHRQSDFLSEGWPDEMKDEAKRLASQVSYLLNEMADRLFGQRAEAARRVTAFALLDVPYSAVHRYVAAGKTPPQELDRLISTAYHAVVDAGV
ncbi:MAG: helix-turn-helix domain-containing protein [Caldimonas sp.]